MTEIHVHQRSGFCSGVNQAIRIAENYLKEHQQLNALGDLIHNPEESKRLRKKGLQVIDETDMAQLRDQTVLIRSHGVHPGIYELAEKNRLHLIDATCVIVRSLQEKISEISKEAKELGRQIVIYGKKEHPEVVGLAGNSHVPAVVVLHDTDLGLIDPSSGVYLFAQTTMDPFSYKLVAEKIGSLLGPGAFYQVFDSLCKQCVRRAEDIADFAARMDVVVFVSGRASSNGKMLYERCLSRNPAIHWITSMNELQKKWFVDKDPVGVCGSASTPMWYLEVVKEKLEKIIKT